MASFLVVHEEVGVEFRYLHSAYAVPLQPCLIDKSSRGISRGVPKEGTAGESPRLFPRPEGSGVGGIIGGEVGSEYCIDEEPMRCFFEDRVAVGEFHPAILHRSIFVRFHVENGRGEKCILHFEPEASSIARDRSSDGARESDPLAEEGVFPCFRYLERERGYELPSHRPYRILAAFHSFECVAHDNPFEHLEGEQYIRPASEKHDRERFFLGEFPDIVELSDILLLTECEEIPCGCRGMEGRVPQNVFVLFEE